MYGARSGIAGASGGTLASLPFTGLSVIWLVLAAVTIVTMGTALVRLARR